MQVSLVIIDGAIENIKIVVFIHNLIISSLNGFLCSLCDIIRQLGQFAGADFHAAQIDAALEGTIQNLVDQLHHNGAPVPDDGCQLRIRRSLCHDAVISNAPFAALLRRNLGSSGVHMLCDDIAPGIQQRLCSLAFACGVIPAVGIGDDHLNIRVDRLRAQREGVDAAVALGIGERGHIPKLTRLGFHCRSDARQISRLIDAAEIVGEVGIVGIDARRMQEVDIGVLLCSLLHKLAKSEAVAKDDVAPGFNELVDGVLAGAIFRDIGLYDHLIIRKAKLFLHVQAASLMGIGIAHIARISDIDQADFKIFLCERLLRISGFVFSTLRRFLLCRARARDHRKHHAKTKQQCDSFFHLFPPSVFKLFRLCRSHAFIIPQFLHFVHTFYTKKPQSSQQRQESRGVAGFLPAISYCAAAHKMV